MIISTPSVITFMLESLSSDNLFQRFPVHASAHLPDPWIDDLHARERVEELLNVNIIGAL